MYVYAKYSTSLPETTLLDSVNKSVTTQQFCLHDHYDVEAITLIPSLPCIESQKTIILIFTATRISIFMLLFPLSTGAEC